MQVVIAFSFATLGAVRGLNLCQNRFLTCNGSRNTFALYCGSYFNSQESLSSLRERINECNDMKGLTIKDFLPFIIDGKVYGYTTQLFAENLINHGNTFRLIKGSVGQHKSLMLSETLRDLPSRSAAVAEVLQTMKKDGIVTGWRDELVAVSNDFHSPPALLIERAAYEWFGANGYGVHVNGYINDSRNSRPAKLWVGRRAANKSTWPNMFDHISAGGQPYGIGVRQNVIKECSEEAGIHEALARRAQPVGLVSYRQVDDKGRLKRDTLFCFDLELPTDFMPTPADGEVQEFACRDMEWVMRTVARGGEEGYKPNCNLVVIDFLVRHGIISPDCPGYQELVSGLRM